MLPNLIMPSLCRSVALHGHTVYTCAMTYGKTHVHWRDSGHFQFQILSVAPFRALLSQYYFTKFRKHFSSIFQIFQCSYNLCYASSHSSLLITSSTKFTETCTRKLFFSIKIYFWINTCISSQGYSRKIVQLYFTIPRIFMAKNILHHSLASWQPMFESC